MKNKLDFRAIIMGCAADLLSTTLFSFIFYGLASVELSSHSLTNLQIKEHIANWAASP